MAAEKERQSASLKLRETDIRHERVSEKGYTVWRARFAVTAPYTEDLWPVYVVPYAEERR